MRNSKTQNRAVHVIKKSLLSAFVVATFSAYALESRANAAGQPTAVIVPTPASVAGTAPAAATPSTATAGAAATTAPTVAPTVAPTTAPTAAPTTAAAPSAAPATTAPTAAPTATPTAAATATSSGYRNGTYTGPVVNVRWGYVQIQATIQNDMITSVQFLQYPNERVTSARINSSAVPALQREAIQAQSANVNIVTGATLTSMGFAQSLQAALSQAKG